MCIRDRTSSTANSAIRIKGGGNAGTLAQFIHEGAAELYHNGTKRIETTGAGASVTGILTADNLSITGVSTYNGNLDVDASVDISTNLTVDGLSDLDELKVAGISTFLGNVNIGDDVNSDVLTLNAKIDSHLIPNANDKDIGSSSSPWRNMYVNNISGTLTGSASQLNVVEDESFNVDETRLAVTINAGVSVITGISTDGIEVGHEVEELDDNQGNNIIPAGTTVDEIGNSQITLNQETANALQTIGTLRFGYFGDTNAVRNLIFSSVATNGTTIPLILSLIHI